MKEIREPVFAGSWYPGDPSSLSRDIKEYLARAKRLTLGGEILALVSPHAGYMFSGQVAAYAYKQVDGLSYDSVIVIAPSHRAFFRGISIYDRGGFRTPLGVVPIDVELSRALMEKNKDIRFVPEGHTEEHSLEIQLPFLQTTLKPFKLVALVMEPEWTWETCQGLASAVSESVKGKKVLLVASSDLSHYHGYSKAVEIDKKTLNRIEAFDPDGLYHDLREGRSQACGGGPIVALMLAAKAVGANRAKVLKYLNSGDVSGDRSRVVGYGAVAFYKAREGGKKDERGEEGWRRSGIDRG